MSNIELIGFGGSILVFTSMCFRTATYKGHQLMRIFNFLGSLVYIHYGYNLKAYSILCLNSVLAVVNLYHLYRRRKEEQTNDSNIAPSNQEV